MIGKLQGGYKSMSFSEEIKRTRQKSLMTQEEFAKEISVSVATINRWETGKARPNITAIKRIKSFCIAQVLTECIVREKDSIFCKQGKHAVRPVKQECV